ncbi:hypothetical protein EV702DRAFT_1045313 [Suillus placidus]|uniref:Uncharacterized protein n=1 Tax=Suillus placidus TaxID=48579 RepID=A0A9P7D3B4_9AGAM|nr:hypothetical protein EV702DRAFT_1045313 [Suillus placidus]
MFVNRIEAWCSLPAPPPATGPSMPPPQHPNVLAIQRALPLPASPPSAAPSISSSKDRNYFFLKKIDLILFSATQTVAATPDDSELKYTGPLFQCLTAIQIITSGTTHTLSGEQKASWQWLEDTLYHATSTFSIDSLLPLEFSMLDLPSSYGYLCIHTKHSHAL